MTENLHNFSDSNLNDSNATMPTNPFPSKLLDEPFEVTLPLPSESEPEPDSPANSPIVQPTTAPGGWWQTLGLKKQVAIVAILFSTLPVLLIGGTSYFFPSPINTVLFGSVLTAIAAGTAANLITRRALRPLEGVNAVINQLGQGKLAADAEGNELAQLEEKLKQLSQQLQTLSKQQARQTQQRQLLSNLSFRTRQVPKLT